ncbi:hypothetical protein sync_1121 [Synechococcus sp. CC9311]|nr:hypothetical protein sync_1121 [Synechococcus sp. CC9311]
MGAGIGADVNAGAGGCRCFPLPSTPADGSAWCTLIEAEQPEPVVHTPH